MPGLLIYFEVIDGRQSEFETVVRTLCTQVKALDPRFQLYSLAKLRGSAARYVMVERFEDALALEAHRDQAYVIEAMPKIDACLAGPPVVEWLDFAS